MWVMLVCQQYPLVAKHVLVLKRTLSDSFKQVIQSLQYVMFMKWDFLFVSTIVELKQKVFGTIW